MKDYIVQAGKNQIRLSSSGSCQLCGSAVKGGIHECVDMFEGLCSRALSDPRFAQVHLLAVDAHALQHPEIHGKLSNHFHLLRLHLLLQRGADPALGVRHAVLDDLLSHPTGWPALKAPAPGHRGSVTVAEVACEPPEEHETGVRAWAGSVYAAWRLHHEWAERALHTLGKRRIA